jgi:hypothetical protein
MTDRARVELKSGAIRCRFCDRAYIQIKRHEESCKKKTPEIHTTDRAIFKSCRQRWHYSSNLRLNLEPYTPQENLEFGDAIHQALSAYYDSGMQQVVAGPGGQNIGPLDTMKRSMIPGIETFDRAMKDWYGKLDSPTAEDDEKFDDLSKLGHSMLDQYMRFATIEDDFEVMWTERVFHIPLLVPNRSGRGTRRVVYSFRTDGLVRDSLGRLWVLEFKTAATIPDKTDYLLTDDQVGSYIWCLNQLEEVKALGKIEGVLYRWLRKAAPTPIPVLQKGTLSTDKRRSTTYEQAVIEIKAHHDGKVPSFYNEFLEAIREKNNIGKTGNLFIAEERVRRNPKEIAIIGEYIKFDIAEMVNEPRIIRNPSRFNCNSCAFLVPCVVKHEGGNDADILADGYQQRKVKYSVVEEG